MMPFLREPAMAGRFYPADPERLRAEVKSYLSPATERVRAIGCIVPHAGYMYSGATAGAVFSRLEVPDSCIILCPNHTGRGHALAIMSEASWKTPLGNLDTDPLLAGELMNFFPALTEDSAAHQSEHAIEVELPFLQVCLPKVKIVPLVIGTGQLMILQELGVAVADAIQKTKQEILIIASSDMNHYENDVTTRIKDRKAIEKILALDAPGLYGTVVKESISMCGFGPAVIMLTAACRLGATKAELVDYATSADASGDRNTVVGYAGILVR
jgi:MEMO1 family protein